MEELNRPGNQLADKLLEIIGISGIIVLIALPATFYNSLPDEIPTHFGFTGKPDDFGGKAAIWMLPTIGVVMYAGLAFLNYFLVRKNIALKINPGAGEKQKQSAFRLLQFLKAILAISFAYIEFGTIQTALGRADGLGVWFLPVFIILLILGPVIFLIRATGKS